jgi:uncharacterized protein (TIGR04222 family)
MDWPVVLTYLGFTLLAILFARSGFRLLELPATAAGEPDPHQMAFLVGGRRHATDAALGALRMVGAVGLDPSGGLVVVGDPPAGSTPLERAVHAAVERGVAFGYVVHDSAVSAELDRLESEVVRAGWHVSPLVRETVRAKAAVLAFVAVAGFCLFVSVLAVDVSRAVLFLVLPVTMVVLATRLFQVPASTPAGRAALDAALRAHGHLAPDQRPAWATYGVRDAVLAIALFGTVSLWMVDPAFATALRVPEPAAETPATGACGAGCGGCGGCGG